MTSEFHDRDDTRAELPDGDEAALAAECARTAQAWGLTVLHVDADFETIATVTSLRTQRADQAA